jgi:type I restriction enzyme S subunit
LLQRAAVGGEEFRVGDVAEVRKGLSYTGAGLSDDGMPMVNLANAAAFGGFKREGFKYYVGDYKPRHVAHGGDLLVANTEQTWRNEILGWPMLLPSDIHEALFTHHTSLLEFGAGNAWLRLPLWAHLFSADARARVEGMAHGTTVAAIPSDALMDMSFQAPPQDSPVLAEAQALIERSWAAERESAALAGVRDALLPELMSGRLAVREAESVVSDAV